jgi:pimeloyl-ACP methyl ester carboxylesterase
MAHPLNDVVVVLPGIMGSVLHDKDGHEVWGTSLGALVKGVLTRGAAAKRLQLPEGIGDEPAPDGVVATRLVPDIHVIPGIWTVSIGYDHLAKWFRDKFDVVEEGGDISRPVNFVQFAYDWRLSNRASADALKARVEPVLERFRAQPGHADAKLIFIGHSMGGLVARYYVDVLGNQDITRKVITLGTPHRGALNAVVTLVNGISKGFGPLKIDLTNLSRSLPALYQLLPEYACIETPDGLRKTTEVSLPDVNTAMVTDAMKFHEELRAAGPGESGVYQSHPVLARTQPTDTTARLVRGKVEALRTIDGRDEAGDGTVPRLSAAPYGVASSHSMLRYVMEKHGALPSNDAVGVELEGVLTGTDLIPRAADFDIGVACDDVLAADETLRASIEVEAGLVVDARLHREDGSVVAETVATDHDDNTYDASFDSLPPGRYALRVGVRGSRDVVTTPIVVLPAEEG